MKIYLILLIFIETFIILSWILLLGESDNMKKYDSRIFLFIAILIVFCASFQPIISGINIENDQQFLNSIDRNSAILVACAKLKDLEKDTYTILSSNEIFDDQGNILCYAFDLLPQGYIVVTAYKTLPPILAYSFTSSFSKSGTLLYDLVKADIVKRLTYFSEISEKIKKENLDHWNFYLNIDSSALEDSTICQWPKEGTTVSSGWIQTDWHQNFPYNNFCPIDLASGYRSIAGCPAVAMAQILNFHYTTNNIHFNDSDDYHHSYGGNNYIIDDNYITYDFPSFPQLNSYLDNLLYNYQNQLYITDENKAALVFACGVAAHQVYHPNGSGTFGVDQAYHAYQRFSFDNCELIENDPDLYERVQENVINGLPVYLAVVDETWQVGHNLIIDGYREDGYYHLNFGWGGPYDGWYNLPQGLPYDLTIIEGVIVDIINNNSDSDLHGQGVLYWPSTKAGATVEGSFTIENVGEPTSEIDWEVIIWPVWGEWSFEPFSGEDLTPEFGPLTINVSVKVPNWANKHFTGYVKVVDVNNSINSCLIHVSLTTKLTRNIIIYVKPIFQRYLYALPFLRYLLNLK